MKKNEQIINLISILKRLHKQQTIADKKVPLTSSTSMKKSSERKKDKTLQTIDDTRHQSQQKNIFHKNLVSTTSYMSSRIHPFNHLEEKRKEKDVCSELVQDLLEGQVQNQNYSQMKTGKKRSLTDGKAISGALEGVNLCRSYFGKSKLKTKQQKIQLSSNIDLQPDSLSHFLWVSPLRAKGNQFHWSSAIPGKLKLKKYPSISMNEKSNKKMNKYHHYCQQIYQKNRVKAYENFGFGQSQCGENQCELGVCIQKFSPSKYNRVLKKKGFIHRSKLMTEQTSKNEGKYFKVVRNIDLKAIANRTQRDFCQNQHKQVEAAHSHQEENQLIPKLGAPGPSGRISPTQPDHQLSWQQKIQAIKPTANVTKRNPSIKYKYRCRPIIKEQGPKFRTEQLAQVYEDAQIKIEGWQMNNKICNYGKVKNIISRSASIHGHDLV